MATKIVSLVIFLVILSIVEEMVMVVQVGAVPCKARSSRFRGSCSSKRNCINICQSEGFEYGRCTRRFFRSHCMCYQECGGRRGGGEEVGGEAVVVEDQKVVEVDGEVAVMAVVEDQKEVERVVEVDGETAVVERVAAEVIKPLLKNLEGWSSTSCYLA
ncbi:Defensin-like protein [Quillaja saponaria]|uniref:Defensin-like protein n=1 Tax=Quillaja saponaria TaxID=32244 RepID=A0AAD7VN84_QUISA|nr:Defensin-like protein [Quillaja saponaria]